MPVIRKNAIEIIEIIDINQDSCIEQQKKRNILEQELLNIQKQKNNELEREIMLIEKRNQMLGL